MKIIVPMAGRGSRLRPHTLTIPKPLVPVAGIPIVEQLVRDIAGVVNQAIEEVAFVLGEPAFFGDEIVSQLLKIASDIGAKGTIYRQLEPLGTGHAIMCAAPSLSGPAVVAYADTLIRAKFQLDPEADSIIWVKKVAQPEAYGVVQLNEQGAITELVEKPKNFVSDLAVIGIYYFKAIEKLKAALQTVLDEKLTHGGEYQINDGIKRLMSAGDLFLPGEVDEWMDCGNKQITLETNSKMLGFLEAEGNEMIDPSAVLENATVIPPCYIGPNVQLKNVTLGPGVSVGTGTVIENATVTHSLIQNNSTISNATLHRAMIGNHVIFDGRFTEISLGDYTEMI
ncbi:sugar phosphate nucleotidyltransferase [Flavobacteriaceae bacterium]|nr:sugar phosphate nucleotidyltransferase [Flavobacteriaceae bacterium]MDC1522559.1 sugar phosphate nucleotidyltransferase [Flavobacteriaceae bacterium]